jgi:hypothetical protein
VLPLMPANRLSSLPSSHELTVTVRRTGAAADGPEEEGRRERVVAGCGRAAPSEATGSREPPPPPLLPLLMPRRNICVTLIVATVRRTFCIVRPRRCLRARASTLWRMNGSALSSMSRTRNAATMDSITDQKSLPVSYTRAMHAATVMNTSSVCTQSRA